MAKNYFKHSNMASSDPRMVRLLSDMGVKGIGAYWCIMEYLHRRGGKCSKSEYNCITSVLQMNYNCITKVIEKYGLFSSDENFFWSNELTSSIEREREISEKRKSSIRKRWNKEIVNNSFSFITRKSGENSDFPELSDKEEKERNEKESNKEKDKREREETSYKTKLIENNLKERITLKGNEKESTFLSIGPTPNATPTTLSKKDLQQIMDLYHELCPSFPRLRSMSEQRKMKVRVRFVDEMKRNWDTLREVFAGMEASDFLRGRKINWKATFDWVFENSNNWVKVIEGNYDNKNYQNNDNRKQHEITARSADDYGYVF